MSPAFGIVADDLTGACDAAAAFATRGWRTCVHLTGEWDEAEVVALTTASRGFEPARARAEVMLAVASLRRAGARTIFLKIDSMLRGPLGAAIDAALATTGRGQAIVCSAFPAQRRGLLRGRLAIAGSELDPAVDLPSLLRAQGAEPVATVGLERVRAGRAELLRALGRAGSAARLIVVDALEDDDLARLVDAVARGASAPLLVGSAGLATAIAVSKCRVDAVAPEIASPLALVMGTTHPSTLAQLEELRADPAVAAIPLDGEAQARIAGAFLHRSHALLTLDWQPGCEHALGTALRAAIDHGVGGFVLTGGDTAAYVCRILGARAIRIAGEVAPGIAWGRLIGGAADGRVVCTKSGGFGDRTALVGACRFLAPLPSRAAS